MDFSERLLTLRKSLDLTQEQLAEKLNVSRQSVSKWESGQSVPELDIIVALSVIFGVTTDSLLKPSEMTELSVKTELLEKQQQHWSVSPVYSCIFRWTLLFRNLESICNFCRIPHCHCNRNFHMRKGHGKRRIADF